MIESIKYKYWPKMTYVIEIIKNNTKLKNENF